MPAERYFLDDSFSEGKKFELEDAEFHHLVHVMRSRAGDQIELVNGRGALAKATVENLGKKAATLNIEEIFQQKEQPSRLILAQALPKLNRLDFILEKGTELGVDSFWLFPGHYSVKKDFFPNQVERCRQLTIAAMKQCGRLFLPSIQMKPSLEKWDPLEEVLPFFGDTEPEASLFEAYSDLIRESSRPVLFITGPESGFHEKEIAALNKLSAQGVKLHNNILRTDTASLAALSLISHWQIHSRP